MSDPKPGMAGHDCDPLNYMEEADYYEEHNDDFAPADDNEPLSLAQAIGSIHKQTAATMTH